jgi:hypothetical protein
MENILEMFSHVDTSFCPGHRPATKQISLSDQVISHQICGGKN